MPSTEVVALTASDSRPPLKDCLSCRVWGGIVHLGFAGFVGSHYNRFHDRFSRSFIALFSLGLGTLGVVRLFDLYNPIENKERQRVTKAEEHQQPLYEQR